MTDSIVAWQIRPLYFAVVFCVDSSLSSMMPNWDLFNSLDSCEGLRQILTLQIGHSSICSDSGRFWQLGSEAKWRWVDPLDALFVGK